MDDNRITNDAPRLGEHTDEIMSEAGYGAREIEAMRREGVI